MCTAGDGVCARPKLHGADRHEPHRDGQEPRRVHVLPTRPGTRLRPVPETGECAVSYARAALHYITLHYISLHYIAGV